MYSFLDVLERLISMRSEMIDQVESLISDPEVPINEAFGLKMLKREMQRRLDEYLKFKKGVADSAAKLMLDHFVYDKISFICNTFKKNSMILTKGEHGYRDSAARREGEFYALIVDIKGRIVNASMELNDDVYIAMELFLDEEEDYLKGLQKFIKEQESKEKNRLS